jgi:ribulose-5-phosphate 4-epimerase/fuculose-1-phosphate aldolase
MTATPTIETRTRTEMSRCAKSLFARGYAFGTAGNVSVRLGDFMLVSPTNSSFETLEPESFVLVGLDGIPLGDLQPSKEAPFHLACLRARPQAGAVLHLHSTYAVALSCLRDLDENDAMRAITPYYAMRIGRLPVVPYLPPGDSRLAPAVEEAARGARAILLRNHGPIVIGKNLADAVSMAEELEEHAKLVFLLGNRAAALAPEEVEELKRRFPS